MCLPRRVDQRLLGENNIHMYVPSYIISPSVSEAHGLLSHRQNRNKQS